jgi:hypothetical protein
MGMIITQEGAVILFSTIFIGLGIIITMAIFDALEVRRIVNDKTLSTGEELRRLEEEGFK